MNRFRVWLRPLAGSCMVRVDGFKNARWLLNRLSQSFVFKTSQAIYDDEAASCSTFYVQYNSQTPFSGFEKAMGTIREVNLMSELA
jgi:hypothetical protein